MNYYLQIDASRVAVAITQTSAPIHAPHMIEWPTFDESLLGQRHDEASGRFVALPPVAVPGARRITLGALQKRIGPMTVFAIDTSTNLVCVALRAYLSRLSFVGLDDPDLQPMLSMMVAAQMPEANPAFPGSGPLTAELVDAIISADVQPEERP